MATVTSEKELYQKAPIKKIKYHSGFLIMMDIVPLYLWILGLSYQDWIQKSKALTPWNVNKQEKGFMCTLKQR
jgi:hypothetical protein